MSSTLTNTVISMQDVTINSYMLQYKTIDSFDSGFKNFCWFW